MGVFSGVFPFWATVLAWGWGRGPWRAIFTGVSHSRPQRGPKANSARAPARALRGTGLRGCAECSVPLSGLPTLICTILTKFRVDYAPCPIPCSMSSSDEFLPLFYSSCSSNLALAVLLVVTVLAVAAAGGLRAARDASDAGLYKSLHALAGGEDAPHHNAPHRLVPVVRAFSSCLTANVHSPKSAMSWRAHSTKQRIDVDVGRLLDACDEFLALQRVMGVAMAAPARYFEANIQSVREGWRPDKTTGEMTMRELLEAEARTGIHKAGGVLKDPSAACGLLWLRRTIAFHSTLFGDVAASDPNDTLSPRNAALHAYAVELEPFHGSLLRRVYRFGLPRGMLPRAAFLARLRATTAPCEDETLLQGMRDLVAEWRPLLEEWRRLFVELDLEDPRKV